MDECCRKCGSGCPQVHYTNDGLEERLVFTCRCGYTWDTPPKDAKPEAQQQPPQKPLHG